MGKQAKVVRDRKCLICEELQYTTAAKLEEHAKQCARAKRLGIELPTIKRPKYEIIRP